MRQYQHSVLLLHSRHYLVADLEPQPAPVTGLRAGRQRAADPHRQKQSRSQRHFFYDDDDGVRSFESFRKTYQRDPAWEIEDRGAYVRLTGHGPDGRRIEIFANVDRKSTRLNSSHLGISYAVFCLKK